MPHNKLFKASGAYLVDFMAETTPWSDETDPFVTDLDNSIGSKYNVSLRKLLVSPAEYASTKGIADTVQNMRSAIDKYFTDLVADLSFEEEEFTKELTDADTLYNKVEQALSSKAAIAKIPYIRPADMDLSLVNPEIIYIDTYNNGLESLITKFINSSEYIANISSTYRKYNIGSWFFSGNKGHVMAIKPPQSILVAIENAHNDIDSRMDDAATILSPKKSAK